MVILPSRYALAGASDQLRRRPAWANSHRRSVRRYRFLALVALVVAVNGRVSAAPDTLVVCPAMLQPGLTEWKAFRAAQGHRISVISAPSSSSELQRAILNAGQSSDLKYLLLVGDVPIYQAQANRNPSAATVPTNYVAATVNLRWGSTPTIATDIPYADLDGDELPDLAVGRIPATTPAQLAAVMRKSIDYEIGTPHGDWERKLNIASGQGGFGAVTDAIIEAAARQVLTQTVPAEYATQHIHPGQTADDSVGAISFAARARQQLSEGSLAWVYLGHGLPTELDRVSTATGTESILSVGDVPKLKCSGHRPLAVLVACYTGAMDASRSCLAEELVLADEGPVAVIAATRVTMPYGNTVLGCELLRACFGDRPEHLGDTLRIAERKTITLNSNDQLRMSLDSVAAGLSPAPVDLAAERREHVLMYHLFGDPLLHLRYAPISTNKAMERPGEPGRSTDP